MGLGFKQAGWDIAGAWDWDKYAIQSYKANVGTEAKQGDIKAVTWQEIKKANCWSFGFPCPDISKAQMKGERKFLKGEQSGHFFEIMRLLDEIKENKPEYLPEVLLAENVAEVAAVLPEIQEEYTKRGYVMKAELFDSRFWGVAQARERYFILGIRADLNQAFEFAKEDKNNICNLFPFLDDEVEERYFYSAEYVKENYEPYYMHNPQPGELIRVGTLEGKGWLDYMKRIYSCMGVAPTFNTCQGGHRQAKIVDPKSGRIRRLTATEYAKLQGFENFKVVCSPSQIYKQMGNAVTVNLAKAQAEKIKSFLEGIL